MVFAALMLDIQGLCFPYSMLQAVKMPEAPSIMSAMLANMQFVLMPSAMSPPTQHATGPAHVVHIH